MSKVLSDVMVLSEMRRSLLCKGASVNINKEGFEGKRGVVERINGRTGVVSVKIEGDDTVHEFRHSNLSLARAIKTEDNIKEKGITKNDTIEEDNEELSEAADGTKKIKKWASDTYKYFSGVDKSLAKVMKSAQKDFLKMGEAKNIKDKMSDLISEIGFQVTGGEQQSASGIHGMISDILLDVREYAESMMFNAKKMMEILDEAGYDMEDRLERLKKLADPGVIRD